MELRAETLTAEAFAPFGEVIEQPVVSPTAAGPGWQWWGETAIMPTDGRPCVAGYLKLHPTEPRFDWAERHMRSAELILPLDGDCLIYVGPPDDPRHPDRLPALSRFRAFHVRQGQGALLHPGVWHGAPLALHEPLAAVVLLLQGTESADIALVRFEATPVRIALAQ
jgi:ureidoglycolate lyase